MAIENVVAKDQRDTLAADEIASDGEGFRKPPRLVLYREAKVDSEVAAVAKQLLE